MMLININNILRSGSLPPSQHPNQKSIISPIFQKSRKDGYGFLGGTGPSFAKSVDGIVISPASGATIEIWLNGSKITETKTGENGQWIIFNLDHTQKYDVVGRYEDYEAVISRDRAPKLMDIVVNTVFDTTQNEKKVWKVAVKNYESPLLVNHRGNPVTSTINQSTGIIEFSVGFLNTSYTTTITDSTGRTCDYIVVSPSS